MKSLLLAGTCALAVLAAPSAALAQTPPRNTPPQSTVNPVTGARITTSTQAAQTAQPGGDNWLAEVQAGTLRQADYDTLAAQARAEMAGFEQRWQRNARGLSARLQTQLDRAIDTGNDFHAGGGIAGGGMNILSAVLDSVDQGSNADSQVTLLVQEMIGDLMTVARHTVERRSHMEGHNDQLIARQLHQIDQAEAALQQMFYQRLRRDDAIANAAATMTPEQRRVAAGRIDQAVAAIQHNLDTGVIVQHSDGSYHRGPNAPRDPPPAPSPAPAPGTGPGTSSGQATGPSTSRPHTPVYHDPRRGPDGRLLEPDTAVQAQQVIIVPVEVRRQPPPPPATRPRRPGLQPLPPGEVQPVILQPQTGHTPDGEYPDQPTNGGSRSIPLQVDPVSYTDDETIAALGAGPDGGFGGSSWQSSGIIAGDGDLAGMSGYLPGGCCRLPPGVDAGQWQSSDAFAAAAAAAAGAAAGRLSTYQSFEDGGMAIVANLASIYEGQTIWTLAPGSSGISLPAGGFGPSLAGWSPSSAGWSMSSLGNSPLLDWGGLQGGFDTYNLAGDRLFADIWLMRPNSAGEDAWMGRPFGLPNPWAYQPGMPSAAGWSLDLYLLALCGH